MPVGGSSGEIDPAPAPGVPRPRDLVIPAEAGIQGPDTVHCLPEVRAAVSVGWVVVPELRPEAVGAALSAVGVGPSGLADVRPEVTRLDGGYSWITLRVQWGTGDAVIMRVAPVGGTVEPYDPATEARRLRAVAGVVPAPEVLAVCDVPNLIGRPFGVHTLVPGEALRRPADPAPYREALAAALGALHSRADARALDDVVDVGAAYEAELARQGEVYRRCWRHPGIDVALRWLARHRPACGDAPAFCHGDFRPANVLWTASGVIGGIIDWERAWVGDPLCDVAFSMHLGGWGAIEGEAITHYRAAGGVDIDADRLRYALRFERVRSLLSGMQGLAALAAGRADAPRLSAIGAAAQAGAWDLVAWLEPGLPPLSDVLAPPEAACPQHSDPQHSDPQHSEDRVAWLDRWRDLTDRAATGGPELIEPLGDLARGDLAPGDTGSPGLPQVRWRDI